MSDKMSVKRFAKLLQTLFRASWITASSVYQAAKRYKYFIKDGKVYSSMESFAMNKRIDDFYL